MVTRLLGAVVLVAAAATMAPAARAEHGPGHPDWSCCPGVAEFPEDFPELLDSEWELEKAGFTDRDIRDALAFQRAKNAFMRVGSGWDDYAARRSRALQPRAPWYALPGTDLNGPSTAEHGDWSHFRRFYFYDPAPTLRSLRVPLLGGRFLDASDRERAVTSIVVNRAMAASYFKLGRTEEAARAYERYQKRLKEQNALLKQLVDQGHDQKPVKR